MKKVNFENGEMLFFPQLKEDSIVINIVSKKHFYIKLGEYVRDNGLTDVYFTYRVSQNGLTTVWCHNQVDKDNTDVFLVGVIPGKKWVRYGWWTKGDNLPISVTDGVIQFPDWVEKILED